MGGGIFSKKTRCSIRGDQPKMANTIRGLGVPKEHEIHMASFMDGLQRIYFFMSFFDLPDKSKDLANKSCKVLFKCVNEFRVTL